MTRLGITGHRDIGGRTHRRVSAAVAAEIAGYGAVHGISSLAEGADQIFADAVLRAGGRLTAVIPSTGYDHLFRTPRGRAAYRRLRASATDVIVLPFPTPSDEACWAAGRRVVCLCEILLAVWDGGPSAGAGGTADVVAFAGERGVPTTVVWPAGSRRTCA